METKMKKELDEQLCSTFPLLYADRHASMKATCLCWGFDCGDGWFNLIYDLSTKLEKIIASTSDCGYCECGDKKDEHIDGWSSCRRIIEGTKWQKSEQAFKCECQLYHAQKPKASQVKEKFGELRFYMTNYDDEIDRFIEEAEDLSAITCEECGKSGTLRKINHWLYTRCDACFEKEIQRLDEYKNQPIIKLI